MDVSYRCPMCERNLSVCQGVILVGQCGDRRTLLVLNPEPGNYNLETSDGQPLAPSTRWELSCPLCSEDLSVPLKRRLARLEQVDADGAVKIIMFSKIADEQATFVMGEGIIERHGKDSTTYL